MVRDEYGVMKGERFDGVPVILTVPDKLGFLVTESVYSVTREVTLPDGSVEPKTTEEIVTTMSDKPIPLGKSEVFTVDPRRPASGSGESNITLEAQGIKTISNKVVDTTITDLADALAKTKQAFQTESGESDPATRVLKSQRQYLLVYDPTTGKFAKM